MSTVETNKAIGQIWIYRFDRFHEICLFSAQIYTVSGFFKIVLNPFYEICLLNSVLI